MDFDTRQLETKCELLENSHYVNCLSLESSATNDNKQSTGQVFLISRCFERGLKIRFFPSRIYEIFPPAMATVDDISSVARLCDRLENEIEVTFS